MKGLDRQRGKRLPARGGAWSHQSASQPQRPKEQAEHSQKKTGPHHTKYAPKKLEVRGGGKTKACKAQIPVHTTTLGEHYDPPTQSLDDHFDKYKPVRSEILGTFVLIVAIEKPL